MSCVLLTELSEKILLQDGSGYLLMDTCDDNNDVVLLGGKASYGQWPGIQGSDYSYITNYQKYLASNERLSELNSSIDKYSSLVHNTSEVDIEATKADALYHAHVAQALKELKALQSERAALIRLIDEEESIMVLLLSQPFVH